MLLDREHNLDTEEKDASGLILISKLNLKVIKRDGSLIEFDPSKIRVAIAKAFIDVEGSDLALHNRLHEISITLTNYIIQDAN